MKRLTSGDFFTRRCSGSKDGQEKYELLYDVGI